MTELAPHKKEVLDLIQSEAVSDQIAIAVLTLLGEHLRRSAPHKSQQPELERPNFLSDGHPSFLRTPIHD